MKLINAFTFTRYAIAIKSLFTRTAVRTFIVCAISVFIARVGIRRTFVDIWTKKKRQWIIISWLSDHLSWPVLSMELVVSLWITRSHFQRYQCKTYRSYASKSYASWSVWRLTWNVTYRSSSTATSYLFASSVKEQLVEKGKKFAYHYRICHLQRILLYMYSCKIHHCWRNQRSRRKDWDWQNTHRYLRRDMIKKRIIIIKWFLKMSF